MGGQDLIAEWQGKYSEAKGSYDKARADLNLAGDTFEALAAELRAPEIEDAFSHVDVPEVPNAEYVAGLITAAYEAKTRIDSARQELEQLGISLE